MKSVVIATDDAHTRALVERALGSLDLSAASVPLPELGGALTGRRVDLVVLDGGRRPEALVQDLERLAASGVETRLLLLVEAEALASLRLPVRVPSDFFVRGAASEELSARARALLWPGQEAGEQELVRVDGLALNLATYQAYVGGEPVDFTYLEYALFAFLVTHPNRAYGREMLLSRVWGTDYYGGARTVDVHVRRIRAKIGGELARRLETVRNVGYLWRG